MKKIFFYISITISLLILALIVISSYFHGLNRYFKYDHSTNSYQPITINLPNKWDSSCFYSLYIKEQNKINDETIDYLRQSIPSKIKVFSNNTELKWEQEHLYMGHNEIAYVAADDCHTQNQKINFNVTDSDFLYSINNKFYIQNKLLSEYEYGYVVYMIILSLSILFFALLAILIKFFHFKNDKTAWKKYIFWSILVLDICIMGTIIYWLFC